MQFYSARLLYITLVDDRRPRRRQLCDETVIVFRAHDFDHAFRRALTLGLRAETAYRNGEGQRVRWALTEIQTLDLIGRGVDGAEVSSRLHDRSFSKPVPFRMKFRPEKSRPAHGAPAGLLRRASTNRRSTRAG